MTLPQILDRLERQHGKPKLRGPRDAYEMLLHRNCGYPQSDGRCDKGFGALKEKIGLLPKNILGAPDRRLAEVLRGAAASVLTAEAARRRNLQEQQAVVRAVRGFCGVRAFSTQAEIILVECDELTKPTQPRSLHRSRISQSLQTLYHGGVRVREVADENSA
jgi:hypothetical protein